MPNILLPTDEEDAAITAAALSDPDALPLTDEECERIQSRLHRGEALDQAEAQRSAPR